jgi:hypothetical protein
VVIRHLLSREVSGIDPDAPQIPWDRSLGPPCCLMVIFTRTVVTVAPVVVTEFTLGLIPLSPFIDEVDFLERHSSRELAAPFP